MTNSLENIHPWVLNWEGRTKLVTGLIFIFGVISLQQLFIVGLSFLFSFFLALFLRIPFVTLCKRYLIITPFLLLMTVPLFFTTGNITPHDNIIFAFTIIVKAFTSMTMITLILETQTLEQFMNSLAHLKIPSVLITVLILSYRYVFLFLDDIQKMQLAARSRFFSGGIRLKSLKTYGQLTGSLLTKSIDRSDHVYEAMASRSFNGKLHVRTCATLKKTDILKGAVLILFLIVLFGLERNSLFFVLPL
ncbi:cobalt ECF transporter T component CbiQ [Alkalihalobacillus sp. LMS39]|uniref:cobalt ECF transporter T component CbiQ n=1 Tax=Alkalihalobacillus sp. LMS39 TaxID=2924032 RepID=UPI001FB4F800|nr:cobalt ECF transporter T component CbiQ [Alkalihalobacillus sp. LMS39]UOE92034.1 cobalt ECF transporter T component CbiQ [Alkalihalobacillus sp. LMS39]